MSSCDASSCTCCHAALCASATSDFSLTDGERSFFHSVSGCSSHPISQQQTPPRPRGPFTRCGNVHFAAEPCRLSSASPPPNFSSDLRLISAGAPHESTSPASNLARASARTLVLCLALVRMQYGGAIQTLRCAAPRSFSLRPSTETQALCPQCHTRKGSRPAHPDTNPIVHRGGFLQVAVSEAPPTQRLNSQLFAQGRFRYSTKTSGEPCGTCPIYELFDRNRAQPTAVDRRKAQRGHLNLSPHSGATIRSLPGVSAGT